MTETTKDTKCTPLPLPFMMIYFLLISFLVKFSLERTYIKVSMVSIWGIYLFITISVANERWCEFPDVF